MQAAPTQAVGLAVLVASLLLAGGLQLPLLERWSGLVPWVLLWGLLAFAGCAVVAGRLRPHPSTAALDERDAQPESGQSDEPSESEIRGLLRLDALLHPATLIPLAVVVVSVSALRFLELDLGRGIAAAIVIAVSLDIGATSFVWHYAVRYSDEYARLELQLADVQQRARARLEK